MCVPSAEIQWYTNGTALPTVRVFGYIAVTISSKKSQFLDTTERATSMNVPLLRLQTSEEKPTMSRETRPLQGCLCGRRSRTLVEASISGVF